MNLGFEVICKSKTQRDAVVCFWVDNTLVPQASQVFLQLCHIATKPFFFNVENTQTLFSKLCFAQWKLSWVFWKQKTECMCQTRIQRWGPWV